MVREVVTKWACSECGKLYSKENEAQECESSHARQGTIVAREGYRRHLGSIPRNVWITWDTGEQAKYKRVREDTSHEVED
jgi:hypothetical protein